MDYAEKWGKTVEEATNLALKDLGATIDQVDVEVIEEPTKGFLGIGSKLARVKITYKQKNSSNLNASEKVEKEVFTKKEVIEKPLEKLEKKPTYQKEEVRSRMEPSQVSEAQKSVAKEFVTDIINKMNLDLEVTCGETTEEIQIIITGQDTGSIIGKRGITLDSVQYLTSRVVNKNRDEYYKVTVDAGNYREKREQTLIELAERLAAKVEDTGRSVRLEPMNPYERRVIHATLQSNSNVRTRSEGEDPYRKVVIEIKK